MRGCAAPGRAAGMAVMAAAVSPPSIARKAVGLAFLLLAHFARDAAGNLTEPSKRPPYLFGECQRMAGIRVRTNHL